MYCHRMNMLMVFQKFIMLHVGHKNKMNTLDELEIVIGES